MFAKNLTSKINIRQFKENILYCENCFNFFAFFVFLLLGSVVFCRSVNKFSNVLQFCFILSERYLSYSKKISFNSNVLEKQPI